MALTLYAIGSFCLFFTLASANFTTIDFETIPIKDRIPTDLTTVEELTTAAPVPTTAAPEPTTTVPEPTTTVPEPTTAAPEPTTAAPVPTTTVPEPTTTVPEPTTAAPVPTTTVPEPTTTVPEPTTAAPEHTTAAPVPTTAAPEPTTAALVPTTAAPEPTTAAPEPTTGAPEPTTAAPVPTTAAPVPTTAAPVPTTAAPVPTTAVPVLTTTVPVLTTAIPVPTTAMPTPPKRTPPHVGPSTPAPTVIHNRRCTCKLRATNAKTGWTHKKMPLDILLDEDVDDDIQLSFSTKPTDCLNQVSKMCASHCRGLVASRFANQHASQLTTKKMSVGDFVCDSLYGNTSLRIQLKVQIESEAQCYRRSEKKMEAFLLASNLCCRRNGDVSTGEICSLNVIG